MKVTTSAWKNWKSGKHTLVVFAWGTESFSFLGLEKSASLKELESAAKADGFHAKEGQAILLRPAHAWPTERVILAGLGKESAFTAESLRIAAGRVYKLAESLHLDAVWVRWPEGIHGHDSVDLSHAMGEGFFLGAYRFDRYRNLPAGSPKPLAEICVLTDVEVLGIQKGFKKAEIYSSATNHVRDLVNEPPSIMNPERMEHEALKLRKGNLSVHVHQKKELEKLGMGGILGVGAGGEVPPRLIEFRYKPSGKTNKVVALVGKGITFDSGGLSLKPAQSMETMKTDMAGAATVLAVMRACDELDVRAEVRGYLAMAENMPDGKATKPGDILKAFNGKTIEVLNTDAEGRLVLSDALSYAVSKKPDVVIDLATLTGAVVVALGHLYSGVFSNHPPLLKQLLDAAAKSGEKMWELPLVKEYQADIKSKIADLQNIGARRGEAGSIIGALFLQEFVGDAHWAHIDIAGASRADRDSPYGTVGATGHPVRTILTYLENLS